MSRRRLWIRLGLGLVVLGLLVGLGWLYLRSRARGPQYSLEAAEQAYDRGAHSLEAGDGPAAQAALSEADLLSGKVLENLLVQPGAQSPDADRTAREGRAYWVRARTLRDKAYAAALVQGQPLTPTLDTTTGERFRSVRSIPDAAVRDEAAVCLLQASQRLPADKDIQNEALRYVLGNRPLDWVTVERLSHNVLEVDPANVRALYMLARFDFDQPVLEDPGRPTRPDPTRQRKHDRMVKARDYLARIRKEANYPFWRTLALQGQVFAWLTEDAARHNRPREEEQEGQQLQTVLDTARTEWPGLLTDASRWERMSEWDIEGVFELRLLVLGQALRDANKSEKKDPQNALNLLSDFLAFCQKATEVQPREDCVKAAAVAALVAVARVEPFVVADLPPQWAAYVDRVQELAVRARDRKVADPALYQSLALLLVREAQLEGARADADRRDRLARQALQWLEDGLKLGQERNLPPEALVAAHGLAAELKVLRGDKRATCAAHLQALRDAHRPATDDLADLLDGTLAAQEGRLDIARKLLEPLLVRKEAEDSLLVRVRLVLAGVDTALGLPDEALALLKAADAVYDGFDKLSDLEKAWVLAFTTSREALRARLAIAHLRVARARFARFLARNPGAGAKALEEARGDEAEALRILAALKPPQPTNRVVRTALVAYLADTGRMDLARDQLLELIKDYPDNLDVLRLDLDILVRLGRVGGELPPAVVKEGDAHLTRFLKAHPNDTDAALFWAAWLIRTGREAEAATFLDDPGRFPANDARRQRLLAQALLRKGDQAGGMALLRQLPGDFAADAALIQILEGTDDAQRARELAARGPSTELLRCYEAELALGKGQYKDAANGYVAALDYNRVRSLARLGLVRALVGLADQNPDEALALTGQLLAGRPEEPSLLLGFAYACLLLDKVGSPTDDWGRDKTMAAALNAWERLLSREGETTAVAALLVRADFWAEANRPDLARADIKRARDKSPQSVVVAERGLQFILSAYEPDLLPDARSYLAVLTQARPDAPETRLAEARLLEFQGLPDEALGVYEKLLTKDPRVFAAYQRLIALARVRKQDAKVREWTARWRQAGPDDLLAAHAEVRLLAESGKVPEAVKLAETFRDGRLKQEAERSRDLPAPRGVEAAAWDKQKQDSLAAVRAVLETELARGLVEAGAYDPAEKMLVGILAARPATEPVEVLLGDIYLLRGDWLKARAHYELMLKHHPAHYLASNNLAAILASKLNDPDAALPIIRAARLNHFTNAPIPGDRLPLDFLDTFGMVCMLRNKPDVYPELRDLLEAARRRYPQDPRLCLYLAHAYAGLEEPTKAAEMYTAAQRLAKGRSTLPQQKRDEVVALSRKGLEKLNQPR